MRCSASAASSGATVITFLLSSDIVPIGEHLVCVRADGHRDVFAAPRLLRASHTEKTPLIVAPHGIVLLLAALASVMFLVEGAILDWSACSSPVRGSSVRRGRTRLLDLRHRHDRWPIWRRFRLDADRRSRDFVLGRPGDDRGLRPRSVGAGRVPRHERVSVDRPRSLEHRAGAVPRRRRAARDAGGACGRSHHDRRIRGQSGRTGAIGFVAKAAGLPVAFWLLAALVGAVVLSARAVTRYGLERSRPGGLRDWRMRTMRRRPDRGTHRL